MRRKYVDVPLKIIEDKNANQIRVTFDKPVNMTNDDKLKFMCKNGKVRVRFGKAIKEKQ